MWRWEREFYSYSGIFVVLVRNAGTSGKVVGAADCSGAADFSGATSKEAQGVSQPWVSVALSLDTWFLELEVKPNCAMKCQGGGTVTTSQHHHWDDGVSRVGVTGCGVPQAQQYLVSAGSRMSLAQLCTLHRNRKCCRVLGPA